MALFIITEKCTIEWHVGENMPSISGKVVKFQADGDELEVLTEAIRKASKVSELEKARVVAERGSPLEG